LNFSYERLVGAEELEILEAIDGHEAETPSLDEVSRATSLDSGTVSYLIRGGEDAEGLEPLGLVDIASAGERVGLRLTPMGDTLAESMTVRPGPTSG
jgi:predicted transcriptional regulator